jgi:two-component system sensor histidine kinase/response regulator
MSPIFDYNGSLKRFGNDEKLFSEMVGFFFDDAPAWLAALRTAVAQNDPAQIQRAAHTLKGITANFGASHATAAAAQIEQHVGMGNLSAVSRALPLLENAIDELGEALGKYRRVDGAHQPVTSDVAER